MSLKKARKKYLEVKPHRGKHSSHKQWFANGSPHGRNTHSLRLSFPVVPSFTFSCSAPKAPALRPREVLLQQHLSRKPLGVTWSWRSSLGLCLPSFCVTGLPPYQLRSSSQPCSNLGWPAPPHLMLTNRGSKRISSARGRDRNGAC